MTCEMPTDVMEPTIPRGSVVAVDTAYYYHNEPQRWDVIVFTAPNIEQLQFDLGRRKVRPDCASALAANAAAEIHERENVLLRPHLFFVKRVVGLPGERIRFTEAEILCDGVALHIPRDIRRCYAGFPGHADYAFGSTEYLVPENSVYVLSDNLAKGRDSRYFGAVSLHNLIGRGIL
jgi:signal peptidase I